MHVCIYLSTQKYTKNVHIHIHTHILSLFNKLRSVCNNNNKLKSVAKTHSRTKTLAGHCTVRPTNLRGH